MLNAWNPSVFNIFFSIKISHEHKLDFFFPVNKCERERERERDLFGSVNV